MVFKGGKFSRKQSITAENRKRNVKAHSKGWNSAEKSLTRFREAVLEK
jgi:hypothetical protein